MMGRSPSGHESGGLKKGPWTPEEDQKLIDYIQRKGHASWRALPKLAGLNRCGKSCRLRWTNYLRPDIKRGKFSKEEEQTIINLHSAFGNKWSAMATHLPGRTDNEIKNFWNTHLKKKLLQMGIDPVTHRPRTDINLLANLPQLMLAATNFSYPINSWDSTTANSRLQINDATQLAKIQLLHSILQVLSAASPPPNLEALNLLGSLPLVHDHHQLCDQYLRLNSHDQLEGLGNGSFNLAPNPTQIPFSSLNLDVQYQPTHNVHPITNSKAFNCDDNGNNQFIAIPTGNSLPPLVSASPECSILNQTENKINPTELNSNPSSTSTTFEAWGELVEDEAGDSYWRDIIDQATTPSWPSS